MRINGSGRRTVSGIPRDVCGTDSYIGNRISTAGKKNLSGILNKQ